MEKVYIQFFQTTSGELVQTTVAIKLFVKKYTEKKLTSEVIDTKTNNQITFWYKNAVVKIKTPYLFFIY